MAIGKFLRAVQEGGFDEVVKRNKEPGPTCCLRALAIGVDEGGVRAGLDVSGWRAIRSWDSGKGGFLIWVESCMITLR